MPPANPQNQKPSEPLDISLRDEPKQYIRTLESDSAALKQGAKPGFSEIEPHPLDASQSEASGELLAKPEVLAPPPPPPVIQEEPKEPASARIIEGSSFPTFTYEKKPQPPPPTPPPTPASPEKAPLHTYTSDFAKRIKETKASTATVLAAEGDAGAKKASAAARFNLPLIAGGIVLIILGGGGAYLAYRYAFTATPVQITATESTPIFVNEREKVDGAGNALSQAIAASRAKPLAAGSVRLLYTSSATTTGSDVFHALALPAPGILLRNVNAQGSMAGIVNAGDSTMPFFILRVSSYGETFAGMLAWEPAMGKDLASLFSPSATTTRAFRDEIISNHDIRVERDADGQSIIMYGYWDPSTLLIARDESAYEELLKRLATSRTAH